MAQLHRKNSMACDNNVMKKDEARRESRYVRQKVYPSVIFTPTPFPPLLLSTATPFHHNLTPRPFHPYLIRCEEMTMVCQNGKCVNLPDNKIRCICDPGYRYKETHHTCEDINECEEQRFVNIFLFLFFSFILEKKRAKQN